jgi:WD repeat-containing protein 35
MYSITHLYSTALEQLNFVVADKAFVKCRDYQGIQFVKQLKLVADRNRQRAEVCTYFKRFDEAEQVRNVTPFRICFFD